MQILSRTPVLAVIAMLAACTSSPDPQTLTLEQKAFKAYGTFVVLEEQAARIYSDASVPADIKAQIQMADSVAKPAADSMLAAAEAVKALRDAGAATGPELDAATQALQAALTEALTRIVQLRKLIDSKEDSNEPRPRDSLTP